MSRAENLMSGETKVRNLRADLAICEAATPGPWMWEEEQHQTYGTLYHPPEPYEPAYVYITVGDSDPIKIAEMWTPVYSVETDEGEKEKFLPGTQDANARFIAEAREGWPYAIRRALELEEEVQSLRTENAQLLEALSQRGCGL